MTTGKNLVAAESAPRRLEALRRELAGPAPSALERLLVDRVVLCWFQVNYCEALFAQWAKDLTIPQADYQQRRLDRVHGRYLSAIRTLAYVRRLLVPSVQVNIGAPQVHVANAKEPG
jgi:hypothetical protein